MFHELNVVTKVIEIQSTPNKVFAAWAEPDHLQRWFTDEVTGWPGVGATLSFKWKNFGFSVDYKLAEMRPDTKLVYKTRISGVGTQVLTVNLARRAPKTILTVSEAGPENHKFDPKDSGVDSGWEMSLGVLKHYVEHHFTKDRKTFFAMLPAQFDFPKLHRLFASHEGLSQWLQVEGQAPEKVGDPYSFKLDSGQTMTGHVLAMTHHEMALSWDEIDGYLELKSFPTNGNNKGLCLRGATYSGQKHSVEEIETLVKDTLVKLFAALAS